MYRLKKVSVFILLLLLLPCACVKLKQPSNVVHYYTLEYDSPVNSKSEVPAYAIKIERFSVAPVYDTTQIIYREQPFSRDAYAYHKWRVNPGDMITHLLSRDIQNSGFFGSALSNDSNFRFSYVFEGTVEDFYERDEGDKWKGVLKLRVALIGKNEKDKETRIIFQESYSAEEECRKKNPGALAEALSVAMAKLSGEIINDIHSILTKSNQDGG